VSAGRGGADFVKSVANILTIDMQSPISGIPVFGHDLQVAETETACLVVNPISTNHVLRPSWSTCCWFGSLQERQFYSIIERWCCRFYTHIWKRACESLLLLLLFAVLF